MTRISVIATALIALAAMATAMSAQTELDANGDGAYSFEELLVGYPDLTVETFAQLDADADGALNEAEMSAAMDGGMLPS